MMASAVSNADEADSISWISKVPRKGRPEPQPQSTRYDEQQQQNTDDSRYYEQQQQNNRNFRQVITFGTEEYQKNDPMLMSHMQPQSQQHEDERPITSTAQFQSHNQQFDDFDNRPAVSFK